MAQVRKNPTFEERWRGADRGLITCWEVGRRLRGEHPDIAKQAEAGELPPLGWKGGVEKPLKIGHKIGTLFYLAQWQGLRGEDLDIDLEQEYERVCTRTGVRVLFTGDLKKYRKRMTGDHRCLLSLMPRRRA